jgi:hypothetical protein
MVKWLVPSPALVANRGWIVGRQHASAGIELELHNVVGAEHRHAEMLGAGVDKHAMRLRLDVDDLGRLVFDDRVRVDRVDCHLGAVDINPISGRNDTQCGARARRRDWNWIRPAGLVCWTPNNILAAALKTSSLCQEETKSTPSGPLHCRHFDER